MALQSHVAAGLEVEPRNTGRETRATNAAAALLAVYQPERGFAALRYTEEAQRGMALQSHDFGWHGAFFGFAGRPGVAW